MATLPPQRQPGSEQYAIALVCLGNICRSAMADVVLQHKLAEAGLGSRVALHSSGTGTWHIGEPMSAPAAAALVAAGYDPSRHQARLFERAWFDDHDVILVMDESNRNDVLRLAQTPDDRDRVLMFRDFDPEANGDLEVPDPFSGDASDYEHVHAIVERTTDTLVAALSAAERRL